MSASALYSELVGSDDDYSDDDYYDEECDDFYSPYAPKPPIAPEPEIIEVKEEPKEFAIVEYVTCEDCKIEVPKNSYSDHLSSRKHKGVILEARVSANQEELRREAHERYLQVKEVTEAVFSPQFLEKVRKNIFL